MLQITVILIFFTTKLLLNVKCHIEINFCGFFYYNSLNSLLRIVSKIYEKTQMV